MNKWYLGLSIMFGMVLAHPGLASISIEGFNSGSKRYWILHDPEVRSDGNVIVFLHGFGASNPACYGGWIKELVRSGSIVVFPKFHSGVFIPRTKKFQKRVDTNIEEGLKWIETVKSIHVEGITFVTHSIGGIIGANLANEYGKTNSIRVLGIVLIQPGFRYLKLGRLENYPDVNKDAYVLAVTGAQDRVAGDRFADHFLRAVPQIGSERKLWLKHHPNKQKEASISAKHKDPVCPDREFDTGNRNIVILGSFILGKTDHVDRYSYWKPTESLLALIRNKEDWNSCEDVSFMGYFPTGSEMKRMTIMKMEND